MAKPDIAHEPKHGGQPSSAGPGTAANPPQSLMQELKVSGHLMALPAGLFCIVNEGAQGGAAAGLPGVRISPPPVHAQAVEIAGFRPDGWLAAGGDAALVRVTRGPAQVLVTIYQLPTQSEAPPRLQVMQLLSGGAAPVAQPVAPKRMDVLAHIQTRGDVGAPFGERVGEAGSANWVEGFAIAPPEGIAPADLTYQAVLGRGWLSPWVEAGQYCGSRGMALPLLGFRVRLAGAAAAQFDIACSASFTDGTQAGPAGNDESCEAASLAPLESLLVVLTPRVRGGRSRRK
jgi:Clostridial hydrophobic W